MYVHEGIFYMLYHPLDLLELDVAKKIVEDRLALMGGEAYPCLFDITKVRQSSKEARDYMADEGNDLVLASAILVTSPMLKMMANFFIMVNKPKNPTRMFTDRESALEWLAQFKTPS
ncbi:MAG: hypothetical protein ACO1O1_13940 [Adhaeribacter sp.]